MFEESRFGMDLFPLNLVLALATAWATIFLGYLPTRLLRTGYFVRQPLFLGAAWLAVAACSSPEILHYHIGLALLCFVAWWRLRGDHGLGGKLWLAAAGGLGISLGVVLILAVSAGAWPAHRAAWVQGLFLARLYLGGAIPGLAGVLYFLTRPEAVRAGALDCREGGLLLGLILAQAILVLAGLWPAQGMAASRAAGISPHHDLRWIHPGLAAVALGVLVLPLLGRVALGRIESPRPSTAGALLLAIGAIGFLTVALGLLS